VFKFVYVWKKKVVLEQIPTRLHPDTWARDILCDSQFMDQERAKTIMIMWLIWHSQNKWKHDEELSDPVCSVKAISEALTLLEFTR
jgi:hypothetical protein